MLFVLGSLWALPTSLIGLLFALLCGVEGFTFRDGVLCFVLRSTGLAKAFRARWAAITFANIQVYGSVDFLMNATVRKHENRHTWQAHILGPFFLPLYGLASAVSWVEGEGWYSGNLFEEDAVKHQGS